MRRDGHNDDARRVGIRSCWLSQSRGGQAIFHFEGSDSMSDAEKLVGLEVQIPLSERMPLPSGSYYITDLVGCEVREAIVGSPADESAAPRSGQSATYRFPAKA